MKYFSSALLAVACTAVSAQYNSKGTIRLGIGLDFAAHATHYEQNVLGITTTDDDGAASVTFPIDFQYGFSGLFSLGLLLEPGHYLDDTDSQFNNLLIVALQPRFYLVNKDRFSWMASLQLGSTSLRIHDDKDNVDVDQRWRGGFFGLSTGIGVAISDHFGLEAHLRYLGVNFDLRHLEIEGNKVDDGLYDASLETRGTGLQITAMFKL